MASICDFLWDCGGQIWPQMTLFGDQWHYYIDQCYKNALINVKMTLAGKGLTVFPGCVLTVWGLGLLGQHTDRFSWSLGTADLHIDPCQNGDPPCLHRQKPVMPLYCNCGWPADIESAGPHTMTCTDRHTGTSICAVYMVSFSQYKCGRQSASG